MNNIKYISSQKCYKLSQCVQTSRRSIHDWICSFYSLNPSLCVVHFIELTRCFHATQRMLWILSCKMRDKIENFTKLDVRSFCSLLLLLHFINLWTSQHFRTFKIRSNSKKFIVDSIFQLSVLSESIFVKKSVLTSWKVGSIELQSEPDRTVRFLFTRLQQYRCLVVRTSIRCIRREYCAVFVRKRRK